MPSRSKNSIGFFVVVVTMMSCLLSLVLKQHQTKFVGTTSSSSRRQLGLYVTAFTPTTTTTNSITKPATTTISRQHDAFVSNNNQRNVDLFSSYNNNNRLVTKGTTTSKLFLSTTAATTITPEKDIVNGENPEEETETMNVRLPTNEDDEELLKIRHTTAHVMAMAVQRLYPDAQVTIGPWIDTGFYYDFYFPPSPNATTTTTTTGEESEVSGEIQEGRKLSEQDLKNIKKEMDKIISKNLPIQREEVSREEARTRILALNEPFKLEILDSIKTEPITIYHIGERTTNEPKDIWWDLCAGPHVTSTGQLPKKAIELQSVAGSYWRGDETKEQLQRIYGTAWRTVDQLKLYKQQVAEAKKRDHRTLGKKLDLFSIQQEDAGGGLVFWHPKGSKIRSIIENFWKDSHTNSGYDLVYSPHIANIDLWKTSGHFDFYKQDMFDQIKVENELYQLKPMNCPFHCLIYKNELRSYRDLPYRWAELGTVYRYERSGTLHGLFRVRGFTQDDAHIFCLPEQLQDEIVGVLDLTEKILQRFGFNQYDIMLSTRPEKSVGGDDIWDAATTALVGALQTKGWKYSVDEGGGAFYGPKIDVKIRDAIGRQWQCSTIQCDFNLPERFDLEYASADGTRQRPIMVHRAIFGSMERFFGILIENSAGDFPLWLAPTQLKLLPVTDSVQSYCDSIAKQAASMGIRVEIDRGTERLAKQIRNAEQQRIPIVAVIGTKEAEQQTMAIRSRKLGDLGTFTVTELLNEIVLASANAIEMTKMGTKPEVVVVVDTIVAAADAVDDDATTAVVETTAENAEEEK